MITSRQRILMSRFYTALTDMDRAARMRLFREIIPLTRELEEDDHPPIFDCLCCAHPESLDMNLDTELMKTLCVARAVLHEYSSIERGTHRMYIKKDVRDQQLRVLTTIAAICTAINIILSVIKLFF